MPKQVRRVGYDSLDFRLQHPDGAATYDVNEKIDRLTNSLQRFLGDRSDPNQILQIFPLARVQVVPKEGLWTKVEVSLLQRMCSGSESSNFQGCFF